jgi:hypothetical protein
MPSFCKKHLVFYTFGRCPKCLQAEVLARNYALITNIDGRWGYLRAHPESLNQDQFGICGTSSCVYLLLRHKPAKAIDLFFATFADIHPQFAGRVFTTAVGQVPVAIKFKYLARRYRLAEEKQILAAPIEGAAAQANAAAMPGVTAAAAAAWGAKVAAATLVHTDCFVDYCLSRALGYVLKKTAKNRYDGEKAGFNMEFDPGTFDYRNITHFGNLALRTNNLAFILHDILGANNVHIVYKQGGPAAGVALAPPTAGVHQTAFTTVAQLQAEFNNRLAGPRSFAVAAVYGNLVKDGHVDVVSPGNVANPVLTYNHWIVINRLNLTPAGGVAGCPNSHADLRIWTWAKNYKTRVCSNHLLSYIQDVIFGDF